MRILVWSFISFVILSCSPMDKAVAVHNTAPVVRFEAPIEGETFEMRDAITFVALVEDTESDPEELELEWTSDLGGLLEEVQQRVLAADLAQCCD